MADVVLVCMPFIDLQRPSLGISLLKAILDRSGITTETRYGTFPYAERLGLADYFYLIMATRHWETLLLGDWIFRAAAFPEEPSNEDEVLAIVRDEGAHPERWRRLPAVLAVAQAEGRALVDEMARDIVARRPRIVGCTSTFVQHVAALALLRRVRELDPAICTMLGGANCETVMGKATHANYPWVDFVVSGEADGLMVDLCQTIMAEGRDLPASRWARGVLAPAHRLEGYPCVGANPRDPIPRATFNALDTLPYPDFSDWFRQLAASPLAPAVEPGLPVETSRGCWWGAKTHCTFCGLNGGGMTYRRKSPARAVAEMEWLADRWGTHRLQVADNILDMDYFEHVLPHLSESGRPWSIFYEVKSNLRRSQIAALAAAGVRHQQPGIESLDTRVLALMRKGARSWQQVQYLKFAREYGIDVSWNTLIDFPFEEDAWYEEMAALIPLLTHLSPPKGIGPIRYDRYSPHFDERERFGVEIAPHAMMPLVMPMSEADHELQCYHFRTVRSPNPPWQGRPGVQRMIAEIALWQAAFWGSTAPLLVAESGEGVVRVIDRRACAAQPHTTLRGVDAAVHEACDEASTEAAILQRLSNVPVEDVREALARLEELRLVVVLDGRWLSLAVSPAAPQVPYPWADPAGALDFTKAPPGSAERFRKMFLDAPA